MEVALVNSVPGEPAQATETIMTGTEVALFESVALFLQMTDADVMDRGRRRRRRRRRRTML